MPEATERLSVFVPFARVDADRREVWGWASTEALAHDGRIITFEASNDALTDWFPWGNIREQHDPKKAVGRAIGWKADDEGRKVYVGSHISVGAEDTWQKVLDRTLTGYSISGTILEKENRKVKGDDGIERDIPHVTKFAIDELSLVDRPSDPGAVFAQIIRSADTSTLLSADPGTETQIMENGDRFDIAASVAVGQPSDLDFGQPDNVRRDTEGDPDKLEKGEAPGGEFENPVVDKNDDKEGADDGDAQKVGDGGVDTTERSLVGRPIPPAEVLRRMREIEAEREALLRGDDPKPADPTPAAAAADPSTNSEVTVKRSDDDSMEQCVRCSGVVRSDDNFCRSCGEKMVRSAAASGGEGIDLEALKEAYGVLTRLLAREAGEVASGETGDVYDVKLLTEIVERMQWVMQSEASEIAQEAMSMSRAQLEALTAKVAEIEGAIQRSGEAAVLLETLSTELTTLRTENESLRRSATTATEERLVALEGRLAVVEGTPLPGPISRVTNSLEKLLPGDGGAAPSAEDVQKSWNVLRDAYKGTTGDNPLDGLQADLEIREIHRAGPQALARVQGE